MKKTSEMSFWEAFWWIYGGVRMSGANKFLAYYAAIHGAITRKSVH